MPGLADRVESEKLLTIAMPSAGRSLAAFSKASETFIG